MYLVGPSADITQIFLVLPFTTIMGETGRDWGSTWLFVLWALLVIGSIAGGRTGGVHSDIARKGSDHAHAIGAFFAALHTVPATTTHAERR